MAAWIDSRRIDHLAGGVDWVFGFALVQRPIAPDGVARQSGQHAGGRCVSDTHDHETGWQPALLYL